MYIPPSKIAVKYFTPKQINILRKCPFYSSFVFGKLKTKQFIEDFYVVVLEDKTKNTHFKDFDVTKLEAFCDEVIKQLKSRSPFRRSFRGIKKWAAAGIIGLAALFAPATMRAAQQKREEFQQAQSAFPADQATKERIPGEKRSEDTGLVVARNYNDQQRYRVNIGDTPIELSYYHRRGSNIIYFNMHDNENTAVDAAKNVINKHGGTLIQIHAQGKRPITFQLNGKKYSFDPNRMFTNKGIKPSLKQWGGTYSRAAHRAVKGFASAIIEHFGLDSAKIIVAVHNNKPGGWGVNDYRHDPGAAQVAINPSHNPDDFFYTTSSKMYRHLSGGGFNIVLQNNRSVVDDGSLSVYCGKKGILYVNVEAHKNHLTQQINMLNFLYGTYNSHF